jgi:hypothetical protein
VFGQYQQEYQQTDAPELAKIIRGLLAAGMHHAASACALALTEIEPRLEAPRDRSGSSDLYATARGS